LQFSKICRCGKLKQHIAADVFFIDIKLNIQVIIIDIVAGTQRRGKRSPQGIGTGENFFLGAELGMGGEGAMLPAAVQRICFLLSLLI
jgi:hypothetical protein